MPMKKGQCHKQETIEKMKLSKKIKPNTFLFEKGNTYGFKKEHKTWNKGQRGLTYQNVKPMQEHNEKFGVWNKNKKMYEKPEDHPMFGRIHKKKSRLKMRQSHLHIPLSQHHINKIRIGHVKYIAETGGGVMPMVGKYETEIIEKLEKILGFTIKRNFYINGYYLDGYNQECNLAIEIDEEYHFVNNKLTKKDIIRQQEITKALNCKFFRVRVKDYIKDGKLNVTEEMMAYA